MPNTKIALVTGANRGIGYQTATQLTDLGMTVVLGARDGQRGAQAAAECGSHAVTLDVTDPASAAEAAAEVERRFGRLDILVNNAGILGHWEQTPSTITLDTVREVFETNVFGVITVTNAMLPLLSRSSAGRIVNVSSSAGSLTRMSDPGHALAGMPPGAAYSPSKTALNAITVQYAKELREHGILVNAADPGFCATDFTNHTGQRSAAQGAAVIVRLATLGPDGPTGRLYDEDGQVPW